MCMEIMNSYELRKYISFKDGFDKKTQLILFSIILIYFSIISYLRQLRFEYIQNICKKAIKKRNGEYNKNENKENLEEASTWRIHNLITACELKFEALVAMNTRGLFITYAIPSISSVLHKTGGFDHDTDRRYADMELLIREFCECAIDGTNIWNGQPDRAKKAILRLNAIHDQYSHIITYRDMVYVLTVFMTAPQTFFNSRWSWRSCSDIEKDCIFWQWVDIGEMMNLQVRKHFKSIQDVLQYKQEFESKHMRYAKCNEIVAKSTIEFFLKGVVPSFLHGITRPIILRIMSVMQETPRHASALGLPTPTIMSSPFDWLLTHMLYRIIDISLTTKAILTRYLLPPLPLSWIDRLTGSSPINQIIDISNSSSSDSRGSSSNKGCPFAYRPSRPLLFNNKTYTPKPTASTANNSSNSVITGTGEYIIENMGPKHIPIGKVCMNPRYLGADQAKII